MQIMIKGKPLSKAQFDAVQDILVDMMNASMSGGRRNGKAARVKQTEEAVIARLKERNLWIEEK